jgi:H/ACA ribonucleoprotein complex subunit 2
MIRFIREITNRDFPAAAQRTLKRGVKEVVKALRKSPNTLPPSAGSDTLPIGVVILAADISPMDVISHIPVLCEDHNIPYIYVTSRAELGMAGQTKRPTSVVMVSREAAKKAADKKEGDEEWVETYKSLVKVVEREGKHVKI